MTHDHPAVQLAVAALDFELTPDERQRMQDGLAACAECAAIAASHHELQDLLGRLPVHDASPLVRQRVLRASLVPPRTRQWQLLLVAAALLGLLLAGGALTVGALRSGPADPIGDPPPALVEPTSPEPTSTTAPDPASPPVVGSVIVDPTPAERLLLGAVPPDVLTGCVRSRTTPSDPAIEGDVAGIDCVISDGGVTESRYFLFGSAPGLAAWWQRGIRDTRLQPDSGGCVDGSDGETAFEGGRVQCFVAPGGARLRWFDEERLVYGVVVSDDKDVSATLDWWTSAHAIGDVRAEPSFTQVEQELVDEAPTDVLPGCIPYRIPEPGTTVVEGNLGAIDCLMESGPIIDVGYFRFPTAAALDDWWASRRPGLPVDAGSGGCVDGSPGERGTSVGRIACYVDDGQARIRWIDRDRLVYGVLNGRTSDLERLFIWWADRHDA